MAASAVYLGSSSVRSPLILNSSNGGASWNYALDVTSTSPVLDFSYLIFNGLSVSSNN